MSRARDLYDRLVAGGEAEVLSFIAQPVTEELFLDYKRSADNGQGRTLHDIDKNNLAKAISGFGNSEGGVIVWGVDCRQDKKKGDIPDKPVHLSDPVKFKSLLEQATTGLTVPPHSGVQHYPIAPGFVVTLIPEGMHAPYQTVPELSFYIRAGSNFAKAPHAVLAGMFGKRPQPSIKMHWLASDKASLPEEGAIKTDLSIVLRNFGRGVAHHTFCNASIAEHPGQLCDIQYHPSEEREMWSGRVVTITNSIQMVMRSGFALAPEQDVLVVNFGITLRNPIERNCVIKGMCGCADGEPYRFEFRADIQDIVEGTDALMRAPIDAIEVQSLLSRFNKHFYRASCRIH
jgi:hypothetical protein